MLCSHLHLSSQEKRRKRRDKGMPERLWKLKRLDMQVGKFPCKLANIGSSLQGCLIKWLKKELWKRGAAHCTWEWHLEVVLCESIMKLCLHPKSLTIQFATGTHAFCNSGRATTAMQAAEDVPAASGRGRAAATGDGGDQAERDRKRFMEVGFFMRCAWNAGGSRF